MVRRGLFITLGWVLLSLLVVHGAHAQERPDPPSDTTDGPPPDSLNQRPSGQEGPPPEQRMAQSGPPPGQQRPQGQAGPGSGNENAISFSAQDSLVIRTDSTGRSHGTLHGSAEVSYQQATLQARTIKMDFQSSTLDATGPSSDTAQAGRPVFTHGGDGQGASGPSSASGAGGGGQSFTGQVLSYNMNTERGRVVEARTQQRDGYVQGNAVKMYEDSTLFVQRGTYTTCDCPPGVTPSYSLRSSQMKLKDRWVYTGPIQLYLFNVPTPLWLPFGFLPNVQGRRSGPLAPQYGEDNKGFYLRDWGWYFALNSYTDLTIRGGIWSKGSFEIKPRFRYNKRYNYDGDLQFTYQRVRIGEDEDPNPVRRHEGELRWTHSQTLSPTASINGDIDLATSGDFARQNSDNYDDAVRQDVSSSINYRKRWPNGGRSMNISARQSQKLQSGEVRMTLPNFSFSQNSFKPFRQGQRVGSERWYEKITTSYDFDVRNTYNFSPQDPERLREQGDSARADALEEADIAWYDALVDREKYRLATGDDELYDFEASHQIPLNVSFRVDRYNLSLSPSVRYRSDWYANTVRRVVERDSTGGVGTITERTEPGFYARHDLSSSFSTSSEIYGTFPVSLGPFEGLRHTLSPRLSMNYQPNFNTPFWGRTRQLQFEDGTPVPEDSVDQAVRYDILNGQPIRSSTQQWSLNFAVSNDFETKRVRTDTTGERQTDKVNLLNLDVSGLSYNFAADSFRVGNNISVNARTRIDPFNVSLRSSFSPYALRPTSVGEETVFRRVDRLMLAESPLTPARLTDFSFSLSANFSSNDGGRGRGTSTARQSRTRGTSPRQGAGPRGQSGTGSNQRTPQGSSTTSELSNLGIPWSLDLNFNYGLQKPQKEVTNRNATLSVGFTLNITPLWRVRGDTGYDFMQGELSTTRIRINRNLGCWNMSFTWVPFGRYQKYGFNLQVSSGQLSQLLQLQIPNQGGEGRLGGFGDRLRGAAQGAAGIGGAGGRGGGRY